MNQLDGLKKNKRLSLSLNRKRHNATQPLDSLPAAEVTKHSQHSLNENCINDIISNDPSYDQNNTSMKVEEAKEHDNDGYDDDDDWFYSDIDESSLTPYKPTPLSTTTDTVFNNVLDETARLESLSVSENNMDDDFVTTTTSTDTDLVTTKEFTIATDKITSNSTEATIKKPTLKGEDVFTEACVKTWQGSRIKAWEGRYLNPEGYYYRFVIPGEGQQNGGWSSKEHTLFMNRYQEWISHGWKIGASWGLFSKGIPHRVGYQCMNYYRKLLEKKTLKDDSYEIVDGKLKQTRKDKAPPGDVPDTDLGPEWDHEDVKEVEKNVNLWLKQYHQRSGCDATRPTPKPKPLPKPRRITTKTQRTNRIASMVRSQHLHKRPTFVDDDNDDDFVMLDTMEPEQAYLAPRDWDQEWKERLDTYKTFCKPYQDKDVRYKYWLAKQEWRRGLSTTEMMMNKEMLAFQQKNLSTENNTPAPARQQLSLSRFFTGVKKVKVDTPDELIHLTRIPVDLYSGVKQILPLIDNSNGKQKDDDNDLKAHYYEVDDMMECSQYLENSLGSEQVDSTQSQIEGLLVDPPWEFILEDGRNDGSCHWNLHQVRDLMEKVLQRMSAGLVFMWTHKLIQADVVRMMYSLGCKYVENLVWFKKSVNNVPLDQPSPYFSSTKEILLMFKKGDGFELRHQRTADVIIDFEQPACRWIHEEYTEPKPQAVFDMIETLLPKAGYDEQLKRGRLVELWAKRSSKRRDGWIAFHQRKTTSITSTDPMETGMELDDENNTDTFCISP